MIKKTNNIVAGLIVCAVSSAASASNSTNEETLKIYTGESISITTDKVKLEDIELHNINPHEDEKTASTGKRKRHVANFNSWWDSLWANADSVKKKDHYFS